MKTIKGLICSTIFLFTFLFTEKVSAQGYSRSQLEKIWHSRYVPSNSNVDSTFKSLWVFHDNGYPVAVDSFMLANVGTFAWQDTVAATRYTHSINVRDTSTFAGGTATTLPATFFRAIASGSDSQTVCFSNWFRYTPGVNFYAPTTFVIEGWVFMVDTLSTVKFTLYGSNFRSVKLHASDKGKWVWFHEQFPSGFGYLKQEDIYFTMKILLSNKSTSKIYFNGIKLKAY